MTEARQEGVRKVNETKIKVRETNGDHQGYIEIIPNKYLIHVWVSTRLAKAQVNSCIHL